MSKRQTIEVTQGATWEIGGVVTNESDSAVVDLTGAAIALRVDMEHSADVIDAPASVVDGPAGEWAAVIAPGDQAAARPGVHRYQVNVVLAGGQTKSVNHGAFVIAASLI